MRLKIAAALILVGLSMRGADAQRRGTSIPRQTAPQPLKGLIVTFHGVLKKLTKNEMLLESDDNQLLIMRCSKKTKFQNQDGEQIKPTAIDLESRVLVEASEDSDIKMMAVTVKVESSSNKMLRR